MTRSSKDCGRCGKRRRAKFFSKKSKTKDGLESICIDCRSDERRGQSQVDRYPYFRRYRAEKRRRLDAVKTEHGCATCSEKDPRCLQFHHRDPKQKFKSIARMYAGTWGWKRLEAEIKKCVVICANCHLKLHRGKDDAERIG